MSYYSIQNSFTTNWLYKSFLLFLGISLSLSTSMQAYDDVYDAPKQREVKVKKTYQAPAADVEKSVPYNEEGSSTSRNQSPSYNNNNSTYSNDNSNETFNRNNDYQTDNYSGDDWNYSYSDRIRRFHNPSIRYSAAWSSFNSIYDPFYSYNSWGGYSYTPSWLYSYNDFYNPFWGSSQIIIITDPWSSRWHTGFYSPYNSWYSPTCSAILYNNYPYYYGNGGYYDSPRRNIVNAPRTGGYNNTPYYRSQGNNYNNTNNSGTNYQNTKPNSGKKWSNPNNNNNSPNQANPNVYKYNKPQNSNQGNWNNSNTAPSNNGWGSDNSNKGGVKIGTRPK